MEIEKNQGHDGVQYTEVRSHRHEHFLKWLKLADLFAVRKIGWLAEAAETNGFDAAYLPGDANLDGEVKFDDFLALSNGFGGSGRDWADGNFNGDREVDFTDFLSLSANFGNTIVTTNAVPEPNSAMLFAFGIVGCVLGFRRTKAH